MAQGKSSGGATASTTRKTRSEIKREQGRARVERYRANRKAAAGGGGAAVAAALLAAAPDPAPSAAAAGQVLALQGAPPDHLQHGQQQQQQLVHDTLLPATRSAPIQADATG
jgi:hypothetical protein